MRIRSRGSFCVYQKWVVRVSGSDAEFMALGLKSLCENCKTGTSEAKQAAEKPTLSVIPSEARNLSFFVFLQLNRREIPRFARNDKIKYFFRALYSRTHFVELMSRLKPRPTMI